MRLNTARKTVESGGININVKMKIDMNGKAFNVLSSGIYSAIEPTVVRELCSNAYDAHVAAGTPDLPFEVQCPSAFDPHFSVKDWGTGLRYFKYDATITNEHDGESTIFIDGDIRDEIRNIDMLVLNGSDTIDLGALLYDTKKQQTVIRVAGNYGSAAAEVEFDDTLVLYSTYFRSTKEDSNEFVGAFGLGSKTPLAYTDNFLVTNRFNGTMRVYNILTNEDNEPTISLMLTTDTDESNGLEVKLAINPDDYGTFKDAISEQLKYFDPLPKVLNEKVDFPEIIYRGENFWIVEGLKSDIYYHSKAHASVGNNAYEIQRVSSDLFKSGNLVLRFAVGEVMVTTSREELKYDDATNTLIGEREKAALEEYTQYVMDSLDADGMTDYEKAEFLNANHTVLDLSKKAVRAKVGNPNYRYSQNKITIPISGWGDYTKLDWDEEVEYDDNGVEISRTRTGVRQYGCHLHSALRWSSYARHAAKSKKVGGNQYLSPTQETYIFVRDNSYSFLKKINYYLDEHDIDADTNVLILDLFSDESSLAGFDALKSLVAHNSTFITLSSITLPKTISTTPYDRNTTPTARMYKMGDHFHAPKYWTAVYTPLTKIETEDTYIIASHHGNMEGVDYDHSQFLYTFFNSGFDYDENITILVLSRVKYEKALTYGFKPLKKLVKKLRKTVTIPVELVNYKELNDSMNSIRRNDIIKLFREADENDEVTVQLDKSTPVSKLCRMWSLYNKRYNIDKYAAIDELSNYMKKKNMPDASDFVEKVIANVDDMVYTVNNDLILLNTISTWELRGNQKQEALIKYANAIFNTGDK